MSLTNGNSTETYIYIKCKINSGQLSLIYKESISYMPFLLKSSEIQVQQTEILLHGEIHVFHTKTDKENKDWVTIRILMQYGDRWFKDTLRKPQTDFAGQVLSWNLQGTCKRGTPRHTRETREAGTRRNSVETNLPEQRGQQWQQTEVSTIRWTF